MFGLYDLAHCSYWVSSASNYILTSIHSSFLSKLCAFQNKEKSWKQVVRFALASGHVFVRDVPLLRSTLFRV
nr:GtrA family protein [uncultured Agathobaculum sp.]